MYKNPYKDRPRDIGPERMTRLSRLLDDVGNVDDAERIYFEESLCLLARQTAALEELTDLVHEIRPLTVKNKLED